MRGRSDGAREAIVWGSKCTTSRRAISLRYTGSGARYTPRNKEITSGWPRPLHELLQPGAPLTCEVFPQVFP